MKVRKLIILVLFLAALGAGIYYILASEELERAVLFDTALWVVPAAVALGIVLGAVRAKLKGKEAIVDGNVIRHGGGAFLEHWGTALGLFVLIASGILLGFLFIPSQVKTLEGAFFPFNLHFIGIVVTLFGGSYFAADYLVSRKFMLLLAKPSDITGGFFGKYLLRRKWTAETKYLSSQKAAFLPWVILGGTLLVTGGIKLAWRVWPIQTGVLQWSTVIHDISALLFMLYLVVHILFVVLIPAHRVMFKSWITGKVPEEYVKEEHPLWYEELKKGS